MTAAQLIGHRRDGRPIYLMQGGAPDDDGADSSTADTGTTDTGSTGGTDDRGFPPNTPVAEMDDKQAAAYWKFQARKHENDAKSRPKLSADELKTLRDKAKRADDLEIDMGSEADKAAAKARQEAAAEADSKYLPRLVRTEFKAAAAGRIDNDALADILEPLDLSKFVTDGEVDTDKVSAFVDRIAPAKGNQQDQQQRRGPSGAGTGRRSGTAAGSNSVASGADLWAERHPKKAS